MRDFERGHCSTEHFAAGVVADWELQIEPDEFLAAFASWPGGPLPGADVLLANVRDVMPVGCLSNTNALHWERQFSRWPILDAFDHRFLSFELGCVKPDRDLFERAGGARRYATRPVPFLDDNLLNVDGATAAGFNAMHTRGVDEARAASVSALRARKLRSRTFLTVDRLADEIGVPACRANSSIRCSNTHRRLSAFGDTESRSSTSSRICWFSAMIPS